MSRGRMLSSSISHNSRVRELPGPGAMLLFSWLIAHCDNRGRMRGNAGLVRLTVIPHLKDVSDSDVETWLARMHELRLVKRYEVDGNPYVQVCAWVRHQRLDRNKSALPPPPDEPDGTDPQPLETDREPVVIGREPLATAPQPPVSGREPVVARSRSGSRSGSRTGERREEETPTTTSLSKPDSPSGSEAEVNDAAPYRPGLGPEAAELGSESAHSPGGRHRANTAVPASVMESPSRSESQSNGTPPALPGRKGVAFPEPVAIPLADGTDWRASTEQLAEWQGLYPAVDVAQAFRSMRGWCLAKPMNRKTAREVESFIVNWLNGDQRRGTGPAARGNGAAGGHRSASDERYKRANERPS